MAGLADAIPEGQIRSLALLARASEPVRPIVLDAAMVKPERRRQCATVGLERFAALVVQFVHR